MEPRNQVVQGAECSTTGTPCSIREIIDAMGDFGGNTLGEPAGVAVDSSGTVYVTGILSDNAFLVPEPAAAMGSHVALATLLGIAACARRKSAILAFPPVS